MTPKATGRETAGFCSPSPSVELQTPQEAAVSVSEAVRSALEGHDEGDWRVALALNLAATMDGDDANASTARELRALMNDLAASAPTSGRTPLDELKRRREGRSAAAS